MADLILGNVVDSITGHLVTLLSQKVGTACGIGAELKKLQNTVSAISAVLRDAEKRRVRAEDVKDWLKKLRDVVYDADDLLDDFHTEGLRRQRVKGVGKRILYEVHIFFSSFNQLVYTCKVVRRAIEIRERLDAIKKDRDQFMLEGCNIAPMSLGENRPETSPFDPEPYVIGRDKEKKEIIEFLLNPDFEENLSVLPIVGFGGLGKTTLARLVFSDERVKEYFTLKLWVCVSTNFKVEDIVRKTLRECTPNYDVLGNLRVNELQKKLGEVLAGKKFLLVLDDMWNDNRREWLKLQGFLVHGAKGSKILVTARSPLVARTMAKAFRLLGGLPEDESLCLLMRMAMKQEQEWKNRNLELIAREILKKCAGVPLAITTIGRLLLFSRNTEEEWLKFKNNDLSQIHQDEGDIMPSLRLSYDFLPSHLKQCFAYCNLFPKDHEFDPAELIHLWMAQGFIKCLGNKQTIEEVGWEYFMELVSRSFFQDIEEDTYGNIIRCKMHDLMHDLAQSVSENNCITINNCHVMEIPEGACHVSVVATEDTELNTPKRDRRIRSLLLIVEKTKWIEISNLDVSCFRNLRALRLQSVRLTPVISNSISRLKHLRSLDLSSNSTVKFLPTSISKLCNLEILNLRECYYLERLPRGITKLVNLRQLDVDGCVNLTHMPRGIRRLTSLQMLGTFVVGESGNSNAAMPDELSELTGLKKRLTIRHLERLGSISDEVEASFSIDKLALQYLGLHWSRLGNEANGEEVLERCRPHPQLKGLRIEGYGGARLPSWFSQMHKLVVIEIINQCNPCRQLPPLDQLHFLKKISLYDLFNLENIELSENATLGSCFPSLEVLNLELLPKFRGWARGGNRIEEGVREGQDGMTMLPTFSAKVKIYVSLCPRFSYIHGRRLQLRCTTSRVLQQLLRNVVRPAPLSFATQLSTAVPTPMMMTISSISSISIATLTSITIDTMEDAEHFPVEFFQSLQSLHSLVIRRCPHLKVLSGRVILRYLTALETLVIYECRDLDLTIKDDVDDDDSTRDLQLQGHSRLRHLHIEGVPRMESLPWWIQHLNNLERLSIRHCRGGFST